ncbi:unnamed protein product [Miscanthus lutarioriparius]|uniref:Uncharacterized protein n=1 Tax=Miscanthus lutarioriparius TaxID=422564 RepID=A0A811NR41_9POAL|nr:unnamed protein product [Miscanthus lutarioriparius]
MAAILRSSVIQTVRRAFLGSGEGTLSVHALHTGRSNRTALVKGLESNISLPHLEQWLVSIAAVDSTPATGGGSNAADRATTDPEIPPPAIPPRRLPVTEPCVVPRAPCPKADAWPRLLFAFRCAAASVLHGLIILGACGHPQFSIAVPCLLG